MDVTSMIFVVIGSSVGLIVAIATLVWWAYRRGVEAGIERADRAGDRARIAALEGQISVLRRQLSQA